MSILAQLINTINDTDSYKIRHWDQYPEGTEYVSSYIEARSSDYAKEFGPEFDYAEFFGLQAFMKDRLAKPITQVQIDIMKELSEWHFGGDDFFNIEGWQYILDHHDGKLPIEIRALPEGTILPTSNALVEIVNTDPKCFWLPSYIETQLLRANWYATTTATKSRVCKDIIQGYLSDTSDNPGAIDFMLHDFGSRGASSAETAALGGMSHLTNFMGTDTVVAMIAALRYYEPEFEKALAETQDPEMAMLQTIRTLKAQGAPPPGFSVEATEHSTMTIKGPIGEKQQIKDMIDKARKEKRIVSIVSDSYDYFHNLEKVYGEEFKQDILAVGRAGGKVVIRPDSGNPVEVVVKTLQMLEEKFGCTPNSKGYKVLPPGLGVLQGDGISPTSLKAILKAMQEAGYSAENLVFGMGGGLLQKQSRDDLNFAQKASYAVIKGEEYEIYKNPITADPSFIKKSKRGRLSVVWDGAAFHTKQTKALNDNEKDALQPVFRNGEILRTQTFANVRQNAEYFAQLAYNPPAEAVENPWEAARLQAA